MSSRSSHLNSRLYETVKRELGPEYIRLFAPHFLSHGVPAGISGMVLSCLATLSLLTLLEDSIPLPVFFVTGIAVVVFAYTFPFQSMVMGKANHLKYFKFFGITCTAITLVAAFVSGPLINETSLIWKYILFFPVLIGFIFCGFLYSRKFATMLAYQQKLWAIKHRLIEEEKALTTGLEKRAGKNK